MCRLFKRLGIVFSMLLAAGLFVVPMQAAAQNYDMPGEAGGADFSQEEISAFASAQAQVMEIEQEFSAEFAQAESPEEQQAIMEEANEKMMDVIEREGLSIEVFNQIATQAQTDPDLQQQLEEAMQGYMMQ